MPVAATVALVIEGFCRVEEKPFGPVQMKDAPGCPVAVRFKVLPAQIGLLLPAVGLPGTGFTVTNKDWGELLPQKLIAVTEILPELPPTVVVMDVELELPVHPEGNVQE